MSAVDSICHACGAPVYDIDVRCKACGISLSSTGAQRMIGSVVLEQYEITDILGQGGMSVVYQGKHKITGQEVALKVLPPELAAYRDVKGRFLEEGRALAQLDHPNIVHLYNFGDDGDCLVLAMQFVRGKTWERLIMDSGKLPWRQSTRLALDVSRALDYAHGRGIIHRDMKPSNVLIRDLDGAATVMDFGIAKMQSSTKLTATGQTMGTVRYMSPEQVTGQSVTVGTDIYSLAVTLYESLVGDTPFLGDTHFEIMTKHLSDIPLAPSKCGVDLPEALERVLLKALAKEPKDRQRSAREFSEQLEAVLEGRDIGDIATDATVELRSSPDKELATASTHEDTVEVDPPRTSSKRLAYAGVGVVLCGAVATAVIMSGGKGAAGQKESAPKVEAEQSSTQTPPVDSLVKARLPSGFSFAQVREFPEDRLRIHAGEDMDMGEIRNEVLSARESFASLAKKNSWALPEEVGLNLVLASPSLLCARELYEPGEEGDERHAECGDLDTWYLPKERSLYVAVRPEEDLELLHKRIRLWVSLIRCIRVPVESCSTLVEEEFGKEQASSANEGKKSGSGRKRGRKGKKH